MSFWHVNIKVSVLENQNVHKINNHMLQEGMSLDRIKCGGKECLFGLS